MIDAVAELEIEAHGRREAPGVYVDDRKLAAIGLRIRRGCAYHGVAINVNADLSPFGGINPCGMEKLEVTRLADLCEIDTVEAFRPLFENAFRRRLSGDVIP